MKWIVTRKKAVDKQLKKLPKKVSFVYALLIQELEEKGPELKDWPNYGKLKGLRGDKRHCHLQKGKPTYISCWEVIDKQKKLIEVYYVGSHENAPY